VKAGVFAGAAFLASGTDVPAAGSQGTEKILVNNVLIWFDRYERGAIFYGDAVEP